MSDMSEACEDDVCAACSWSSCTCDCHEGQQYSQWYGWLDRDWFDEGVVTE